VSSHLLEVLVPLRHDLLLRRIHRLALSRITPLV
jgi:hypothetical protein